ncbi:MAG: glycosyltransferase family 4 protein, partial [Chthoniobacterales bacterium]
MKKIICFKIGGFSQINAALFAQMPPAFPDYEVKIIDVLEDILECRAGHRASLFFRACLRYGRQILAQHQNPRDFFIRFDDTWDAIRSWSRDNLNPNDTLFTFQTQSLFDASHPDIPHFIYTDHTYLANRRYPNRARPLPISERWMESERNLYQGANVNFTSSEFCALSIKEDYTVPENQVQCVASGINVPFPARIKSISQNPRRILFVGVEWERKGGPALFEAFKKIRTRISDAELWIVGCTPAIKHAGVKIYGRISSVKVQLLYSQADVFCLPSRYEPSASVLIEAAAYGLPVVATAVGGSVER